jgi:hypothetical protein
MQAFATARKAKEFLIRQISAEALREGVPLAEIEEKMMYFSETGWTLEGMSEMNAAFEAKYDQAEYEEKVANLIRNLKASDRGRDSEAIELWKAAEALLRTEDHYLLVLIDLGSGRTSALRGSAQSNRLVWMLVYGFIGFLVCAIALYVSMRIFS